MTGTPAIFCKNVPIYFRQSLVIFVKQNMGKIKDFFTERPEYFGILMAVMGVIFLIAAIKDAHWLFGDVNKATYNLKKLDGWVNMFGRKTARIISGIMSVMLIIAGGAWFVIYFFTK